jgi:hypothetical protein
MLAVIVRLRLDTVNKQMTTVEQDLLLLNERDRSPSPPPTYDQNGVRTNTRPMRYRAKLMKVLYLTHFTITITITITIYHYHHYTC